MTARLARKRMLKAERDARLSNALHFASVDAADDIVAALTVENARRLRDALNVWLGDDDGGGWIGA